MTEAPRHTFITAAATAILAAVSIAPARVSAQAPEGSAPVAAPTARAPGLDGRPAPSGAPSAPADVDPDLFGGLEFRFVGPSRAGRVTAVEGHPSHPYTFYQGSTGGGVWKTTNYGMDWENISDGYFATSSIGHVEVADSDPDIIYVGTGSDGIRSNIIIGKGVYKSTDAGDTWTHVGLEDAGQIGAVKAHPTNPDIVYAAAIGNPFAKNDTRGVYRSRDGARTWERVLFASDSVGAVDIELHPTNPDIIYAGMWRVLRQPWTIISGGTPDDGVWRSTDGGDTWERMTEGLPQGLVGKTDFAVSPDMPDRVYALVEAIDEDEGLYRSDDAGVTWQLVNDDPGNRLMHRPFYFTNVTADPADGDVVYVNNLSLHKSNDGGRTFGETIDTPHGDNHDLWINPDDSRIMVQGNDGGASVTFDGGRTWSPVNNQPTAELYQVDVDDRDPYWLYAGQQDDSYTVSVPSDQPTVSAPGGPDAYWRSPGGCETGPAVPKPGDPDIVYANCKGRFSVYNQRTGQEQEYSVGAVNLYGTNPANLPFRFQRVVPIEVSPHDPNTVYHGSQYVHRTTDGGRTWETISPDLTAFRPERQMVSGAPITRDATGEEHYSVLYVIEASQHDPDVIWTGANDGPVHVTRNGGRTWEDVTPPDMPPEGRINSIDISEHDPNTVYVAGYRFLLGDFAPYAWKTSDGGESWELLTTGANGIPSDTPVRVLREDPGRAGLLYAGTEFGLFVSFDDGATWQSFQLNLPVTPVTDIALVEGDLALSTMGRGFWVMDDLSRLSEISSNGTVDADGPIHIFAIEPQTRTRPFRNSGFGWENSARPQWKGSGATIDYWIGGGLAAGDEVRLEILGEDGSVIREYSATAPRETADAPQPAMQRFARGGGATFRLSGAAGAHRFRWDLREAGEGRGGGPMVPPGDYAARLTAGGESVTAPFELRIDPRVAAEGITVADLQAQYELEVAVRATLARARETADAVEALEGEVATAREGAGGAANTALEGLAGDIASLKSRLVDAGGSYPQPMLVSQIGYLLGVISGADQAPGRDAIERHQQLTEELEAARAELEVLQRRVRAAA
ncbi:MAG: hypothetical protein R3195_15810 [Gemmatimonadota bacterium]|nr:hypothetical protein [Gemmatimonadota bacterium]